MAHDILVVTPQTAFGELIRLTLEETSLYHVRLVQSAEAALASCDHIPFSLAILDSHQEAAAIVRLEQGLRAALAGLKVMVIPPANNPHHPLLAGLQPDGFIFQPFYVPDMLDAVAGLLDKAAPGSPSTEQPAPPPAWFEDPAASQQLLAQHLPASSAHTALLIHSREVWLHAGQLSQSAAREVAAVAARFASVQTQSGLAKFIRLSGEGSEHVLCAVPFSEGGWLALVFSPATPLTRITAQTHRAARDLAQNHPPTAAEADASPQPLAEDVTEAPGKPAERALEDFLSQFPSPEPTAEPQTEERFLFPWEIEARQPQPAPEPQPDSIPPPGITQPIPGTPPSPAQISLEDTQPIKLGATQPPAAPTRFTPPTTQQTYTCILLPRQAENALSGDLAVHLSEWLPQICLAFGWQLEGLTIQRQYLQWSVHLPPAVSPGNVVRLLRQQTTQRIFNAFPRYQPALAGEDFWAPGFLIVSGSEPPSANLVADYIQQTRQRLRES